MSASRIDKAGLRLDRKRSVKFRFNGRDYQGFAGDTLASAVLAAGETVLSRSWKYHRPRAILTCGVEEPAALVQLESGAWTIPNAKMPEVELYEGLQAESALPWPSPGKHLLSINRWFTPLFPAGFYYKTFMWPAKAWLWYERFIRKAGGLGAAPTEEDRDRYVHQNIHCDVLVAGGGIAGLAAALAAGRSGARVILADLGAHLGGSAHRLQGTINGKSAREWVREAERELAQMPEVRIIRRGVVFGYHDHNFLTIRESLTDHLPLAERKGYRERLWRVRAAQVVLATGAHERPLVFGNNDLPGVMLSSAMADYAELYGVRVGRKIVLVTTNDSAYADARLLQAAGAAVTVVDTRVADPVTGSQAQLAQKDGITVMRGFVPVLAKGAGTVSALVLRQMVGDKASGEERELSCDAVGMAGGWNPAIHLYSHSGGKARWDDGAVCFKPGTAMPGQASVGACNAGFGIGISLDEGSLAGAAAATQAGFSAKAEAYAVDEMGLEPAGRFWRSARASSRSNISSAIPRWASAPTRASWATSTAWPWRHVPWASRSRTSALRPSGPTTCRCPSAPLPGSSAASCSTRRARPVRMPRMWPQAACSRMSDSGSAPGIFRRPVRICTRLSTAKCSRCAAAWASWTARRWARSTSRDRMRPSC
jgi:sarcosine oxidase, subunit alpha